MSKQKVVVVISIVLVIWGIYLFSQSSSKSSSSPVSVTPAQPSAVNVGGQRTLIGTYICLPHKDTSDEQTAECMSGIKADDGFNYALSFDDSLTSGFHAGKQVMVTGHVVPIEAISSLQWHKYNIKGIMQVERVSSD